MCFHSLSLHQNHLRQAKVSTTPLGSPTPVGGYKTAPCHPSHPLLLAGHPQHHLIHERLNHGVIADFKLKWQLSCRQQRRLAA